MAPTAHVKITKLVEFLKVERPDFGLADVMDLAERMAHSLDETVASTDALLHEEFRNIALEISSLKRDITALRPDHIRFERIPQAGRELDAVVDATEDATQTIMSAAEAIMAADGSDPAAYRAFVDEQMIAIFEACTFQDITGQRIRKVIRTLGWIEERIATLASKLKMVGPETAEEPVEDVDEQRMRELILHGPQMKGDGISQNAVDDFFAKSDQDEIDRLFD
jgi:chemotaxis protein CheZ